MQYTEKQQQAFSTRDRTLLVSAAAGSGKTAVLTKRIIDSLLDEEHPTDITRLLIVTFTKAAAQDMRAKITKSLSAALAEHPGNARLAHQLMMLGSASISTIDSFYLDLVRSHFEAAGVPPTVRIADEAELRPEKEDFMNRVVDEMYREHPDFAEVSDALCELRSEEKLTEILLDIFNQFSSHPKFLEALTLSADDLEANADTPFQSATCGVFLQECLRYAKCGKKILAKLDLIIESEENKDGLLQKYGNMLRDLKDRFDDLSEGINTGNSAMISGALFAPNARITSKKETGSAEFEELIEVLKDFREKFKEFLGKYKFSAEEIAESARRTAKILRLIHTALTRYHALLSEWKKQRELYEFDDISRIAYHLLINPDGTVTDLAHAISKEYDAIYIDEYQDVNAMQDATFAAISTPHNRFMVGDIKQSIYRFRGSEPDVFAGYRKKFPEYAPGENRENGTIIMSECFRCDKPIIDFTNAVFRFLFSHHAERIGYTPADDLNFAKSTDGRAPGYMPPPCEVYCIQKNEDGKNGAGKSDARENDTDEGNADENDADKCKVEIRLIVQRILQLLQEKKADGSAIEPKDIAVLFNASSYSADLAKALIASGVPVSNTFKMNLFETPEVLCIYSLLATIDNPMRDIYLAAALRSPLLGFTLAELINIRSASGSSFSLFEAVRSTAKAPTPLGEKCSLFLQKLERWRRLAVNLPVDKLLRELYRETSAYSLAKGEKGSAAVCRGNLEQLYEYARKFEANGFQGLYRFVRFVDDLIERAPKNEEGAAAGNAVSLMTIHHSKGLEYPVCILANGGYNFSNKDTRKKFLTNKKLACAVYLPNAGAISHANTFWCSCIETEMKALSREEEMRKLYVALTRARERLIVVGTTNKNAKKKVDFAASPLGEYVATSGNSYLEWILTALQANGTGDYAAIHHLTPEEIPETGAILPDPVKEAGRAEIDGATLRERFSYRYPYEHLAKLPAKLSVSRLTPQILDVFDTDGAPSPAELLSPDAEQLLRSFDRPFAPEPENKAPTAAERGTATHEFLQFCDLARAKADVGAELERLITLGFLEESAREAVRTEELTAFFASGFYARLAHAKKIWRETRFNIFLPAREFTADAEFSAALGEEKLLVQGVIDLFFEDENGKLVLCDYKTDRLSPYELVHPAAAAKTLFDRHRQQLSYYRKAIIQIAERAPDEILIYSLPAGTAFADPDNKTEV